MSCMIWVSKRAVIIDSALDFDLASGRTSFSSTVPLLIVTGLLVGFGTRLSKVGATSGFG